MCFLFFCYCGASHKASLHVEPSLHPKDRSHLVMVYNSFNVLFNSVASILLRLFIRDIGL